MRELMEPLGVWEGALWLIIPAAVQWLILRMTRERMRGFRMILPVLVCYALYTFLGAVLVLILCGFGLLLLLSLLFQADLLKVVWGGLQFAGLILISPGVLRVFGRLGLCVAGWGLGWAVYDRVCRERSGEND